MPSRLGSGPEPPCITCGAKPPGLAWGARCRSCHAARKKRANRMARRISTLAALVAALILNLNAPVSDTSRFWVGAGAVVTFVLVHVIVQRMAMEWLPE